MKEETEGHNFTGDLDIDESALDVEWIKQPQTFMKYSEMSAHAERRVRRFEEKIKVLRSEVILKQARGGGEGKAPTAQILEALFRTNSSHQKLKRLLNQAQYDADLLRSAVFAFQQRKTALEQLVTLHGQNYFAGPSVPRDLSKERLEAMKDQHVSKRIKEHLNTSSERRSTRTK